MTTIISVDRTERSWKIPKIAHTTLQEQSPDQKSFKMIKATLGKMKGPNIDDPESFTLAGYNGTPQGVIVLHEDFLNFSSTHPTGMPGIFRSPLKYKKSQKSQNKQSSYDLAIEDIPLSMHTIIRYIVFPASESTVILMNLKNSKHSRHVRKTRYYLQSRNYNDRMITGHSINVKLDLVFWDFERYTQDGGVYGCGARRFPIDSAVLLDPNCPDKFHPSETPVCLLGMDFLAKYPYLMFIPRLDPHGGIDLTLSGSPFVYRPYKTFTEVSKTLVVHIASHHDPVTGNIGCGAFFKSGSTLNLFSGVSTYDKSGKKYTENLWERGVFIGIIKALHVVASFPTNYEFTDVVIRTGCPPINQLLTQIKNIKDEIFDELYNSSEESLSKSFLCSSPHWDLVMYIHRRFLQNSTVIKTRFKDFSTNENQDSIEAAGILAAGGAKMKEFCLKEQPQKNVKGQYITLLEKDPDFKKKDIYVSLGLDGYFYISTKKALKVMEEADQKQFLSLSKEDAVCKLGYPAWEGEVAAGPDGFLDKENYEFHEFSSTSDFTTLDGILGEDAIKNLDDCLENPKWTPEDILEVIKNSTRKIKVHEYLALQSKEYRDNYLKELESKGLETGWYFCKDKSWKGYLRRNNRVYDREGWLCAQDEKRAIEGASNVSSNKQKPDYWHEGKFEEKPIQVEKNSQKIAKIELTDVTGNHSPKDSLTQETFSMDYTDGLSYRNYTTEDESLFNTEDSSNNNISINPGLADSETDNILGNFNISKTECTGIGAMDKIESNADESESTYKNESDEISSGNSSEDWIDSEVYTNIELMDSKKHPRKKHEITKKSGKPQFNAINKTMGPVLETINDERHLKVNDINAHHILVEPLRKQSKVFKNLDFYLPEGKEASDKSSEKGSLGSYKHQHYSNIRCVSHRKSLGASTGQDKYDIYQLKATDTSGLSTSRDFAKYFRDSKKTFTGAKGVGQKWPPFEWALKNEFLKETHEVYA